MTDFDESPELMDTTVTITPSELPAYRHRDGRTARPRRGRRAYTRRSDGQVTSRLKICGLPDVSVEVASPRDVDRPCKSLYVEAELATAHLSAASRHRWNRETWWLWVAERVREHLRGDVYWFELEPAKFALLETNDRRVRELCTAIDEILDGLEGRRLASAQRQALMERLAAVVNMLLA